MKFIKLYILFYQNEKFSILNIIEISILKFDFKKCIWYWYLSKWNK